MNPRDKITTLGGAREACRKAKSEGKKVVLTSGCFDLLHGGHLDLLLEVGEMGFLVIGINSDDFVRRLKGPSRPVRKESDRAYLMAGFSPVKLVIVFDSDYKLIGAVEPDIYVVSRTAIISIWEDTRRIKLLEEVGAQLIELEHREKVDSTTAIIARSVALNIAT